MAIQLPSGIRKKGQNGIVLSGLSLSTELITLERKKRNKFIPLKLTNGGSRNLNCRMLASYQLASDWKMQVVGVCPEVNLNIKNVHIEEIIIKVLFSWVCVKLYLTLHSITLYINCVLNIRIFLFIKFCYHFKYV